ncbi:MAG: hypothetical protein LQ346_008475 [Caloplaca aetnensis]|nr:MAG: hypothetical protein LQ346_008475 [Caloplaca aetnensis]
MLPTTMTLRNLSVACIIVFTTFTTADAVKLSRYRAEGCRSEALGPWIGGPDQGCISGGDAAAGTAKSVIVASTGDVDKNFYTVFFESDDCNPETEIGHKDEGCFSGGYGSHAVWDVGS